MASHRTRPRRRRHDAKPRLGVWAAFLAPLVAVGLLVAVADLTRPDAESEPGEPAPEFALPDTAGGTVRLSDVLAEQDALLYFSMGVGCDGCFLQIPEIAAELADRDIALVPIMVDEADQLASEAARLGVDLPIVVDTDRRVSATYGMLGQYGHGDAPSHSFALVREGGEVSWVRHYAEMFVPADQFLADLPV